MDTTDGFDPIEDEYVERNEQELNKEWKCIKMLKRKCEFDQETCERSGFDATLLLPPLNNEAPSKRCATLLSSVKNKILARQVQGGKECSSVDHDYLAPDSDSDEAPMLFPTFQTPEIPLSFPHKRLYRPLKRIPLPTIGPIAFPIALPPTNIPFKLPNAKYILPPLANVTQVKKSNARSIYNCVKCGQMKKSHVCAFPDNVRSMGTSMSTLSTTRDHLSRYYKCGRVLVCKHKLGSN
ncbi:hypothetical protein THRCLA_21053 [Thraustotheca clavata]|uniref:Uncharacterized protein n=1 Tax=Thraustotheca clavata TaxID=74557 RepID=A0A1W0A1C9_9STRA|nr:hypothetical protein THRCLA_21053 [Thraustotheca clavata]